MLVSGGAAAPPTSPDTEPTMTTRTSYPYPDAADYLPYLAAAMTIETAEVWISTIEAFLAAEAEYERLLGFSLLCIEDSEEEWNQRASAHRAARAEAREACCDTWAAVPDEAKHIVYGSPVTAEQIAQALREGFGMAS
jgi:hypothetical protein